MTARVARLVELYELLQRFPLIFSYKAESTRLLMELEPAESDQYYAAIGRVRGRLADPPTALPDTDVSWG